MGEGVEGVVGGGVVDLALVAEHAGHGAEQHDEAHVVAHGIEQRPGAGHLGLVDPGVGLGSLVAQEAVLDDAGPVQHAVEPPETVHRTPVVDAPPCLRVTAGRMPFPGLGDGCGAGRPGAGVT